MEIKKKSKQSEETEKLDDDKSRHQPLPGENTEEAKGLADDECEDTERKKQNSTGDIKHSGQPEHQPLPGENTAEAKGIEDDDSSTSI